MTSLIPALMIITLASYVIHLAASSFGGAADYLGRNLPPGVKGATLNAIASSLPEVFTTFFLLFYLGDTLGFASGLATCAGSAIFNMTVIPGLCILFTAKVVSERGEEIAPNKKLLLRDGVFFVVAEGILLYIVGMESIVPALAGGLVLGYGVYAYALIRQVRSHKASTSEDGPKPESEEEAPSNGRLHAWIHLDTKNILFPNREWSQGTSIFVLLVATGILGLACDALARSVVDIASILDISPFFTAVILAAAGTSIPDMLLSVRDAQKGNYDDALSNAFGSNIFNIFVALGLPVLVFTLLYGPLPLTEGDDMDRVRTLCMSLIGVTFIAVGLLAIPKELKRRHGWALLAIYFGWAALSVLPLALES